MNWIIASDNPRVTQAGYKTKAAAQRAADRANARDDWPHWHVEPDTFGEQINPRDKEAG